MKFTNSDKTALPIGYAKNETAELLIGNIFMISGGYLSSLTWLGIILIIIGICFDLRVLNNFDKQLSVIRNNVNDAQSKLHHTMIELNQTEDRMKEQQKKLEETKRKTFSPYLSDKPAQTAKLK